MQQSKRVVELPICSMQATKAKRISNREKGNTKSLKW